MADATAPRLSAVIACYKDAQAIPLMYERLSAVFSALAVDYEIIFVNDGSPDDTESVLKALTAKDDRVLAIEHSRNFGSQNAFLSGMELATGDAVVLLDGDLQDPPEVIPALYEKWRRGERRRLWPPLQARGIGDPVDGLQGLLPRLPARLLRSHAARRGRLLVDGSTGSWTSCSGFPRPTSSCAGCGPGSGFKQTGVDYRPARARVWTLDPQPAEEPLVGQEGHLLVQLRPHRASELRGPHA